MTASCPAGLTVSTIVGTGGHVSDCVKRAIKMSKAGLDPSRIVESVMVTTPFASGIIRDQETQTFDFAHSGWTTASFRGRITGGTGAFKAATGTVTGTGTQRHGIATWQITFHLT